MKFLSTGGTQTFIEQLGYPCSAVEDLTSYPSILGGRVKTLHPKVFGGILNRRDNEGDRQQIAQYEIPEIDLVIVDLYPFADTVCSGADHAAIIEKIDIGGISLIRAGAKNYKDVVIVASKAQYAPLAEMIGRNGAQSTLEEREFFAAEAFAVSSGYDTDIYNYFAGRSSQNYLRIAVDGEKHMRYGENPTRTAHSTAVSAKFSIRFTAKRSPTTTCLTSTRRSTSWPNSPNRHSPSSNTTTPADWPPVPPCSKHGKQPSREIPYRHSRRAYR